MLQFITNDFIAFAKIKNMLCVLMCVVPVLFSTAAQSQSSMETYVTDLNELFETAYVAVTDNERFNANEQGMLLLEEALAQPKSFFFDWKNLKRISVLKAEDNKFKIFTWAIIRDNGEYDCFGIIQSRNEKTDSYEVFPLVDRSEEITMPDEAVLDEKNWYGVVYYELITSRYEDRTYYTLLGWSGVGPIKQRKVIEPIYFKGSSPRPIFGQTIFNKEKNKRRVVFEYSKETNMMLRYDEQYYVTQERKNNKKGKSYSEENKTKDWLIVYDLLEPMHPGMKGIPQYYLPSGNESGFHFRKGKWYLEKEVQTLLPRKKSYDTESKYKYSPPSGSTIYQQ